MLKLVGGLLLAAAGYGAGAWRLRQAQRHLAALHQLYFLMGRIRDEIEFRALPLEEILYRLRTEQGLAMLRLDGCLQLQDYRLPEPFTPEERMQLEPVFSGLGQGTAQEVCRAIGYYQKRCLEFTDQAEKKAWQAKQLYKPLGLCSGLLIALLLL